MQSMIEIERKFLVKSDDFKNEAYQHQVISQGYLNSNPARNVRIRIKGPKAFITVKGISNETGLSRFEWEKEINVEEASMLLELCEPGKIEKIRHLVKCGSHTYEVDEFHGENAGLLIAEIELKQEDENFEKPSWLGEEVTGDVRFYNSQLIKQPYNTW